jgi:hypothetical protein
VAETGQLGARWHWRRHLRRHWRAKASARKALHQRAAGAANGRLRLLGFRLLNTISRADLLQTLLPYFIVHNRHTHLQRTRARARAHTHTHTHLQQTLLPHFIVEYHARVAHGVEHRLPRREGMSGGASTHKTRSVPPLASASASTACAPRALGRAPIAAPPSRTHLPSLQREVDECARAVVEVETKGPAKVERVSVRHRSPPRLPGGSPPRRMSSPRLSPPSCVNRNGNGLPGGSPPRRLSSPPVFALFR